MILCIEFLYNSTICIILDATLEEELPALCLATQLVALVESAKITIASATTSITAGAMFLMTSKIDWNRIWKLRCNFTLFLYWWNKKNDIDSIYDFSFLLISILNLLNRNNWAEIWNTFTEKLSYFKCSSH